MNEHLLVLQPTKAGLCTIQYKCHIKCYRILDKMSVVVESLNSHIVLNIWRKAKSGIDRLCLCQATSL